MVHKVENEFKNSNQVESNKDSISKKAQVLIKGKQPPKKKDTKQLLGIEGFFYLTERIIMSPFPGGTAALDNPFEKEK